VSEKKEMRAIFGLKVEKVKEVGYTCVVRSLMIFISLE
jgi:hypothetical protein